MSERCSVRVTIVNRLGLHARPAMAFVDLASSFPCQVLVRRNDQEVDGKSIMHMMMLAATRGTVLEITAIGPQAETCCAALKRLVDSGFDEE